MNHHLLLVLHLLAATIWVGGHLYLLIRIFPQVLKNNDAARLLAFEKSFEPLGMSALLVLVLTGLAMAAQYGVGWQQFFSFSSPIERVVSLKLLLLFLTIGFAMSAMFRVIPHIERSSAKLKEMAFHAGGVTVIAIAMLILGSYVRYGGISF